MVKKRLGLALVGLLVLVMLAAVQGQGQIPTPTFGSYRVGDDYFLANYTQLREYWSTLDTLSDRMKVVEIGTTEEGRPMVMAIITSPENHKNLERYKQISHSLARAEGITEEQAKAMAAEGKAVIWEDGGLHATEVVNGQVLFEQAYQMVTRNDPETLRILDDVILLLVPANPDGLELVADWYMRESDPKLRTTRLPRLYQKYTGHDNNRDSFMATQAETQAINRQLYVEWMPQVVYNAHQTGPAGTILFTPPFRDPFNYNMDPLVPAGIDMVSSAIAHRFTMEGKAGFASRQEASYSTWSNGMMRTTTYLHNQVGILTEISGHPTPMQIGLVLDRQLPHNDLPMPIPPQQVWHFRQSIDYIISAQRAILDVASRNKDLFLHRMWRMGMNSIERGSTDHWTIQPSWVYEAKAAAAAEAAAEDARRAGEVRVGSATSVPPKYYDMMRTPERRDPRGYIIPSDQDDMPTVREFVNTLIKGGIEVHRATSAFEVGGKSYPAGSYVLEAAQAFRPHLRDMMEPQDHPNDFDYPGGPPRPPYDMTGYTLAFQMGIEFDRVLDAFDGPFEKLPFGELVPVAPGKVTAPARGRAVGYLLSHQVKHSFTATNRLLAAKEQVYWLRAPLTVEGKTYPAGTIYVPAKGTTRALLETLSAEIGVDFEGISRRPGGEALELRPVRVGLLDQYGGSMPSGWVRFMFERSFQFTTFEVVYPPQLDAGNLKAKYDVLIFMDGIPRTTTERPRGSQPPPNLPPEWADKVGSVTVDRTIPAIRQFVEEGGAVIAVGGATSIAYHFGLPVANHLVEWTPDGQERPLTTEKYFVPGSLVTASVDNSHPLAYGLEETVDVFFNRSPVFRLEPDATSKGASVVAWYASEKPVRSGWGWGQAYLKNGVAAVETTLGKGKVFLFCPEVTFRAEPWGTFPFFFNAIYYGGAKPVNLGRTGTND